MLCHYSTKSRDCTSCGLRFATASPRTEGICGECQLIDRKIKAATDALTAEFIDIMKDLLQLETNQ